MKIATYDVQVTTSGGGHRKVQYCANGSTHAWYIAKELNPGCHVTVIGITPEWDDTLPSDQ